MLLKLKIIIRKHLIFIHYGDVILTCLKTMSKKSVYTSKPLLKSYLAGTKLVRLHAFNRISAKLCVITVCSPLFVFVCLFDLIFTSQSTIFQLYCGRSSLVEPVLSKDQCVLLKDTTQ